MEMKLHHAAALALMGWYLIVPPAPSADPTLPLSQWRIVHQTDSDVDCHVRALMARVNAKHPPNNGNWVRDPDSSAKCVASDDARLR